ncbi:MAG: FAD-binding oxidoreductase, partial [Acidimicrobiales bacterium]
RRGGVMATSKWRRSINSHEAFTHDSIDGLGYDWGRVGEPGVEPRPPLRVYLPRSTDDVVRCVREANELGTPLTVRASGHSSNDLVTVEGGSVLLTRYLDRVLDVDEAGLTATVQSGAASADVDEELSAMGLGLPVIGDHAHVTVGGFASVGGISASSFRHGLFVDQVVELEHVAWDGTLGRCSQATDPERFARLLTGLGRHGVITSLTLRLERVDKHGTIWRNRRTLYKSLDGFLDGAVHRFADPPPDARFIRGLWIDAGRRGIGQFSVYVEAEPSPVARARDAVIYTGLHGIGYVAGRLPRPVDVALKYAGVATIVLAPRYASIRNAESFSDKILDASVGDPTRYLVAIARQDAFVEVSRRVLDILRRYRSDTGCLKLVSLYLKGITSPYLAAGREGDEKWVEVLFLVAVDPSRMTPEHLDAIAGDIDQVCIDTGSYRYLHSRTGRDLDRLARIDPNQAGGGGRAPWPAGDQKEADSGS